MNNYFTLFGEKEGDAGAVGREGGRRGRWGEVLRYLFYEQNSRVPLPGLRTCLTLTFSVRIIYPACETHFKIEFKKKKKLMQVCFVRFSFDLLNYERKSGVSFVRLYFSDFLQ